MTATGIIRRMDDLNRVIIPREICRSMGLQGGDAIEFFTSKTGDGRMVLNLVKYSVDFTSDFENLMLQIGEKMASANERKLEKEFMNAMGQALDTLKKFENRG